MRKYIRKLVLEAMLFVIKEKPKERSSFFSPFLYNFNKLNEFQSALEDLIDKEVSKYLKKNVDWAKIDIRDGATEAVRKYLSDEETIDNIVDKLNKKQLERK